ncbi:MAG: hypothetical protein JMDDDDMK_05399 [Acidobacteria bacterium]|nr:hypothetical protein [Acidobacteriota bacterium]
MQKKIFALIVALSFAVSLVAPALAYPFTVRIRAEIPFDFMVGSKRLPKGEYLIESLNDTGTLTIRNAKKGKAVNFMTIRGKMMEKPKSKLVFHRYGDQYFLARVWDGTSDTVLKLDKSKAEKRAAKLAKKEENPDEVPVNDK